MNMAVYLCCALCPSTERHLGKPPFIMDYSKYALASQLSSVQLARSQYLVNDAVHLGFASSHEHVTLNVVTNLLNVLAGVGRNGLFQPATHAHNFFSLDLQVSRGTAFAATHRWLVDQYTRVRQSQALARGTGCEQYCCGRGGLAEANGLDLWTDELNRVVDCSHRGEGTTRRVDVQGDITLWIHRFQDQQLGHYVISRCVINLSAEEDNAILEQLCVRVLALETVWCALFELWQDVASRRHLAANGFRI